MKLPQEHRQHLLDLCTGLTSDLSFSIFWACYQFSSYFWNHMKANSPPPLLERSAARWRKRKMMTQTELFSAKSELWDTVSATLILTVNLFPKYLLKIVVRAVYDVLLYHLPAHLSFLNVFSWCSFLTAQFYKQENLEEHET